MNRPSVAWYQQADAQPTSYMAEPPDTLFHAARRTTVADADGRFRFTSLPAGSYRVNTAVSWEAPGEFGLEEQGGVVSMIVPIKAGEAQDVILNTEH